MRKGILISLTIICGALAINTNSYESEHMASNQKVSAVGQKSKDQIVTKYRVHNGKKQYRRWNKTKRQWVDSKWIDL